MVRYTPRILASVLFYRSKMHPQSGVAMSEFAVTAAEAYYDLLSKKHNCMIDTGGVSAL